MISRGNTSWLLRLNSLIRSEVWRRSFRSNIVVCAEFKCKEKCGSKFVLIFFIMPPFCRRASFCTWTSPHLVKPHENLQIQLIIKLRASKRWINKTSEKQFLLPYKSPSSSMQTQNVDLKRVTWVILSIWKGWKTERTMELPRTF